LRRTAHGLIWMLILGVGLGGAAVALRREHLRLAHLASPTELFDQKFARAMLGPPLAGAADPFQLALAAALDWPSRTTAPQKPVHGGGANARDKTKLSSGGPNALFEPPDGATKRLIVAMQLRPFGGALRAPAPKTALAALNDVTGSVSATRVMRLAQEPTAYGAIEADGISYQRLTILQLGDSHTAADFFTGRVRERLQQAFGMGGDAYVVPGRPHPGVRSALFDSDASDGWAYEALQRSDAKRRFFLSGFNAISRKAGAELVFRSRGGRVYDGLEVAFLKEPGGGRAEVAVDGTPAGQVNLDGAADEPAILSINSAGVVSQGFHEIKVKALGEGPVTVTGVDVSRSGDGVSYISLGFPGATVQLLQKLAVENIAADFRRISPDVVVLAFGTNEGFNDNLDVGLYAQQYEQLLRRLMDIRPGLRIVIIGPPDAARPNGVCHAAGVGQDCGQSQPILSEPGAGACKFPVPPKLNLVREAQRKLAEKVGAYFWDWSSAMPGPCGAQIWAAANPPLMARDYVHMTLEGYKQSADRFADYLIPLIEGRQTGAHVVSND
jgi:lysophospholipase L1-like esterase